MKSDYCGNCGERLWGIRKFINAYFFCQDCGRMMRITVIILTIVFFIVKWVWHGK